MFKTYSQIVLFSLWLFYIFFLSSYLLIIFLHCPWHVSSPRKLDSQDSDSIFPLPLIRNSNEILNLKKLFISYVLDSSIFFNVTHTLGIAFHFSPSVCWPTNSKFFLTIIQKLKKNVIFPILSLSHSKTQLLLTSNFISAFCHMADPLLVQTDENIGLA